MNRKGLTPSQGVGLVLLAGFLLAAFGIILNGAGGFENVYVDTGISNVTLNSTPLDSITVDEINSTNIDNTFANLSEDVLNIGDEDRGWFTQLADGTIAISQMVITIPVTLLTMTKNAFVFTNQYLILIGIPPALIIFASVGITLFALFWIFRIVARRDI